MAFACADGFSLVGWIDKIHSSKVSRYLDAVFFHFIILTLLCGKEGLFLASGCLTYFTLSTLLFNDEIKLANLV